MRDEEFRVGLRKRLRSGKYSYIGSSMNEIPEPVPDYYKDKLFIGWSSPVRWDSFDWSRAKQSQEFFLNINESSIHLILGLRGAGKTIFSRATISRFWKSEYHVFALNDIKGELESNNEPVQDKFRNSLGKLEKPHSVPTVMAVPSFLKPFYTKFPKENHLVFQFSLEDLSENDFLEMLSFEPVEFEVGKMLYRKIQAGEIKTLRELVPEIMILDGIRDSRKSKMVMRLQDLIEKKFVGNEYKVDLIELSRKGKVIALNLKYYNRLQPLYSQLYVSMFVKLVTRARQEGELKNPVVFIVDEAHSLIPALGKAPSKLEIVNTINVSRYLGISLQLITQYPSQLPLDDTLKQVRHFFLPYNIDSETRDYILKLCGLYEFGDVQRNRWVLLFKKLNKYEWLYIDRNGEKGKNIYIVKIAMPLCAHMQEAR